LFFQKILNRAFFENSPALAENDAAQKSKLVNRAACESSLASWALVIFFFAKSNLSSLFSRTPSKPVCVPLHSHLAQKPRAAIKNKKKRQTY
jgi:hypothetical protein